MWDMATISPEGAAVQAVALCAEVKPEAPRLAA